MSDYAEQFKLRINRADDKVKHLSERLEKVIQCCEENDLKAVDNETAELLAMLAEDIKHEIQEGKRSLEWHRRLSE